MKRKPTRIAKLYKRARSAITGRFVSLMWAARHAATTIVEMVRRK